MRDRVSQWVYEVFNLLDGDTFERDCSLSIKGAVCDPCDFSCVPRKREKRWS